MKTCGKGYKTMAKETILIVEDDVGTRDLLGLYLQNRGYIVKGAENGAEALLMIENEVINLIVLDIEMPGISGFEVCKKVREQSNVPIIFISSRLDVMDKIKSFDLGGDDYITKPFDLAELEARIKSNFRRYEHISTTKLTFGELQIDLDTYECLLSRKKVELTTKEMKLLIFLAKHPNQIFSSEQIYDHIWGFDSIGDPQTVKVHIKNLRHKIEKDPKNPRYIITARGFGYRFAYT